MPLVLDVKDDASNALKHAQMNFSIVAVWNKKSIEFFHSITLYDDGWTTESIQH